MKRQTLTEAVNRLYENCAANIVTAEDAISPDLAGLRLYDRPVIGIGSADDALFTDFQKPGIIGPWFMKPEQWLGSAKTVIAMFFPFSQQVRESNRCMTDGPSAPWLHGRIEGQIFLRTFIASLKDWMESQGIQACAPMIDERFSDAQGRPAYQEFGCTEPLVYSSNWSERHVAYLCGLGTFGLSKGLITEKGMAGRFTSLIISEPMECDPRPYSGVYDNCIRCGACVSRCPAGAISLEHGKNHELCQKYVAQTSKKHTPRYGCGLCQTAVPCECQNPAKCSR